MLTLRVVVADSVPRGVLEGGASRALDSGASDLGGVLPDNLGEVAVELGVHAIRGVVLAIEGPVVHLTVVPPVGNTGGGADLLLALDAISGTPNGEILAVATVALLPTSGLVYRSNNTTGLTYMSCSKTQPLAMVSA